jgi:uncharacterized glyoxalase superfamily protein PhnB
MKKLTPVFVVDRIEPCLDFWVGRLGFEKTVELPEGDSIGFVILSRGNVEIMYQSRESVEKDLPALAELPRGSGFWGGTYIEVSNIDEVLQRLAGWDQVVPKRTTFYGATEFGVREPGGNVIIFAQQSRGEGGPP